MLTKTAVILMGLGLIFFVYGAWCYLKISQELRELKEEDLVAYYLDLFYRLLPYPFWSAVAGLILIILSLITGTTAFLLDFNGQPL